jgi:hypothetical protein
MLALFAQGTTGPALASQFSSVAFFMTALRERTEVGDSGKR